jgi:general secretion pathway protein N
MMAMACRGRTRRRLPPDLIRALMEEAVAARLGPVRHWLLPECRADNGEKMVARFKIIGLALLCGLILTAGVRASHAATSATLDILPNDVAGVPADRVEVGKLKPLAGSGREAAKPLPGGNPLWSVPLSVLTATQERPIFSASRRPPPRAVVGPVEPVNLPVIPQKTAEPERPPLALIGAVVGDNDAIAVFIDQTNQAIVRLRQGDAHAGWTLQSVLQREVTLKKADQTNVLVLQRQDSPGPRGAPVLPTQATGGTDGSYAPFVARSTPKNGESDGL